MRVPKTLILEFYKGYVDVELEEKDIINDLYEDIEEAEIDAKKIVESKIGRGLHENEFICMKYGKQSYLGCHFNEKINNYFIHS